MRRPASFRHCRKSSVTVEFAIIALVMVTLFLGTIEIVNAVRVQAKLNVAAGQLAEMVADQASVVEGAPTAGGINSLKDMCTGAAFNMAPYNTGVFSASVGSGTVLASAPYFPSLLWESDKSCPTNSSQVTTNPENSSFAGQIDYYADYPTSLYTSDGTPISGGPDHAVVGYSAIIVYATYKYTNVLPLFLGQFVTQTAVAVARPRSDVAVTCVLAATPTMSCPQYD